MRGCSAILLAAILLAVTLLLPHSELQVVPDAVWPPEQFNLNLKSNNKAWLVQGQWPD
jgi:hypothetical protein